MPSIIINYIYASILWLLIQNHLSQAVPLSSKDDLDDVIEITEEMIQLIKETRGGASSKQRSSYNANSKPVVLKTKRRRNKNTEDSSSSSSQKHTSNDDTFISSRVTATIPGYGKAEGRREGGVDIWKGIPYAQPPVGSLRFSPPEAATPWAPSRLDASHFGPDCYQLVDPVMNPLADLSKMSEDCLYLNVYTPAGHVARSRQGKFLSGTKKLPVMVWIHGGAFMQGSSSRPEYDGRKLAERDIIVVSLNYRLGALGFLVSSVDGIYGNFGVMDQRAALDWVKSNIEAFGGDPDNITLFGESAGAVMIGLHLMMEGAGTLFHKAIMQSNPVGYTFRSVVIADFIGEALKRNVDCRDLACLRAERVEEILRAQSSLMGVPRSVGDFFTWSPTLTSQVKLKVSLAGNGRFVTRSEENRMPRLDSEESKNSYISEWRVSGEITSECERWSNVNVTQPLKTLDKIPDNIPIIIGTNQNEGEMFVHSAFPTSMPKAVYWMFVGALFRDSSAKVLKHYRGLVDEVEQQAEALARKQLEEEANKQHYLENKEVLDKEYETLLAMNKTRRASEMKIHDRNGVERIINTWSTGGAISNGNLTNTESVLKAINNEIDLIPESSSKTSWRERLSQFVNANDRKSWKERYVQLSKFLQEKRVVMMKERALKEAAKVVVDYRPVMSAIVNDYLFRCPSWHFAQLLTRNRARRGKHQNNVYVYRFSLPTHIPGYKECWGKSCHTAELPYVFQAMDVIRSNYSTLGPFAQEDAPAAPVYPYSQIMAAYRGALEAIQIEDDDDELEDDKQTELNGVARNHTKAFQRILNHFFGDYFKEDADEEMASDMSERWGAFARSSNPNYDGSKATWLPWRHKSENSTFFNDDSLNTFWSPREGNGWAEDYIDFSEDEYDEFSDTEDLDARDEFYRRRALEAMELDVVAEDVFTTELRRVQYREVEEDVVSLKGKVLKRLNLVDERPLHMPKERAREAVRFAQDLGLLGMGLSEDETGKDFRVDVSEIFFPELLELTWPPEGRLIERDCTCDMWDRIRYRY